MSLVSLIPAFPNCSSQMQQLQYAGRYFSEIYEYLETDKFHVHKYQAWLEKHQRAFLKHQQPLQEDMYRIYRLAEVFENKHFDGDTYCFPKDYRRRTERVAKLVNARIIDLAELAQRLPYAAIVQLLREALTNDVRDLRETVLLNAREKLRADITAHFANEEARNEFEGELEEFAKAGSIIAGHIPLRREDSRSNRDRCLADDRIRRLYDEMASMCRVDEYFESVLPAALDRRMAVMLASNKRLGADAGIAVLPDCVLKKIAMMPGDFNVA